MQQQLVIVLFVLLTNFIFAEDIASKCQTPDREPGTCVPIKSCQPVLDVLKTSTLSDRLKDYLRRFRCGLSGDASVKVCCPHEPIENAVTLGWPDVSGHRNLGLLPVDTCGTVLDQDKIIGGNETGLFEYPWMVLLGYTVRGDDTQKVNFKCGGSIINNRYVLTAAHCIHQANYTLVKVRVGEHNLDTSPDCEYIVDVVSYKLMEQCVDPEQDVDVEETIVHPTHRSNGYYEYNDIALIRLAKELDLKSHDRVKPICLPTDLRYAKYNFKRPLMAAGWGKTEKGTPSPVLLKVDLPYVPNSRCSRRFKDVTPRQMCAGGRIDRDSCKGDSGGPLMTLDVGPHYKIRTIQQGIVSYGQTPCGQLNWPGVYTRVAPYMEWILDNLKP